jgi:hypothetical protein
LSTLTLIPYVLEIGIHCLAGKMIHCLRASLAHGPVNAGCKVTQLPISKRSGIQQPPSSWSLYMTADCTSDHGRRPCIRSCAMGGTSQRPPDTASASARRSSCQNYPRRSCGYLGWGVLLLSMYARDSVLALFQKNNKK